MMRLFLPTFISFTLLLLVSCSPQELTPAEYFQYLENPDNGITKVAENEQSKFKVKYVPVDYLVYQDVLNNPAMDKDSLAAIYNNSLTFLFLIEGKEGAIPGNVMEHGVGTVEEYKSRSVEMNFFMGDHIKLRSEQEEIAPVLTNLENAYDASQNRTLYVVFSKEQAADILSASNWQFVYEDVIYQSGVTVFNFSKRDIEAIPSIKSVE